MTIDELRAACAKSKQNRIDCGLDPADAMLIVLVPGRLGRRILSRKRVLPGRPGVFGRAIGETGTCVVVDVAVRDVERWLARNPEGLGPELDSP